MSICITDYEIICNLGVGIDEIYNQAILRNCSRFELTNTIIKNKNIRLGKINHTLPEIESKIYNTRCNRLILATCKLLKKSLTDLIKKYGQNNIAVVVATTNTGVEEYETNGISNNFEIGNPAEFIKNYFELKNFCTSVSTACSSGIKAFSIARNVLNSNLADAVIVVGVDSIAKVPIFGFNSLEILSSEQSIPFSENRKGINISEGVATFILERNIKNTILVEGIGETTDIYHATTPDPEAKESIRAIENSLVDAKLNADDIDYINLHGTGTISNDLMEANAIYKIFQDKVFCSSTKPLTGHCLGAAAAVEIALCCKLLELENPQLYPHVFDNIYDKKLPQIKLSPMNNVIKHKIKHCLCTSFGFGGTNTSIILGGNNA